MSYAEKCLTPEPDFGLLLNVSQVCVYLGNISERKIWSMVSAGQMPRPLKIARVRRWRRADLDMWAVSLPT